jgi:hypothetical protein
MSDLYNNPEPVPPASQLAVLPFVAAVDGFLREKDDVPGLRITVHRTMSREGDGYLQQICAYLRGDKPDWRGKVGRIFPVTIGIIGAAYDKQSIWRTREYSTPDELRVDLKQSMIETGEVENLDEQLDKAAISYLAIPFLGPQDQVVLILYAECKEFNFFADDDRVGRVAAMCRGFCRLFDWLQKEPVSNLRNFPLQKGRPITEKPTVYPLIQESVDSIPPPRFNVVPSFNYEAAAA